MAKGKKDILPSISHFIHGENYSKPNHEVLTLYNPTNGYPSWELECADQEVVNLAITSSLKAFEVWSNYNHNQRAQILRKAAILLRQRNDELALLETKNTGKPISETMSVDIATGADNLDYFASLIEVERNHYNEFDSSLCLIKRVPLGVCLGIGAWNYPIQIACWKAAPALACGNVMIFKPSELTPLTTLKLAEIFIEAGLPPGAFNVVQGDYKTGSALIEHQDIAKVSLTGSVNTGRTVASKTGQKLIPSTMELGGKSPLIVFDDADYEQAVSGIMLGNFYSTGQICSNGTRVFVQEGIYQELLKELVKRTRLIKIGDPQDAATTLGPLISKDQLLKVDKYITLGKSEGAKNLLEEDNLISNKKEFQDGYFVNPVIFVDCHDDMTIVKEEIFGPVISILKFKTEEEVISRANSTIFGLAAGVFTKDVHKGMRVIDKINAGTCWLNNYNLTPVGLPFGAVKKSGFGRENSREALESYSQIKSIYIEANSIESPF